MSQQWSTKVTPLIGLDIAQLACSYTMDKESHITLERLCELEHSPLRAITYLVELRDIPTFVSTHLVRHKHGVEHFVKSNREDRASYSGDAGRYQPVNHAMVINAQALINMSRKRLCKKAHKETVAIMKSIVELLPEELKKYCVPECKYRGGICHEAKSCGLSPTVREIQERKD